MGEITLKVKYLFLVPEVNKWLFYIHFIRKLQKIWYEWNKPLYLVLHVF